MISALELPSGILELECVGAASTLQDHCTRTDGDAVVPGCRR